MLNLVLQLNNITKKYLYLFDQSDTFTVFIFKTGI